jgi:competence protein ComEA
MVRASDPKPHPTAGLLSITRHERVALLIIFLIALAYAGWHIWRQDRSDVDLGTDIGVASHKVVIRVEGAVLRPGAYTVNEGSSVSDAIVMAGGFVADADRDSVPLGATIVPGQNVVVKFKDGRQAVTSQSGLVNINTASKEALASLPGIGEELSVRIIEYRNAHGGFQTIEDIMKVDGIGQGKFQDIKRLITVSN